MAWNGKMPNPAFLFPKVALTQKCLGELVLHHPIHIMHKHISLTIFPIPSHQPCSVDGTHPPWCLIMIPSWCIHHYQVPFHIIHLIWKPLQRKFTLRKSWVNNNLAVLSRANLHQLISLVNLAVVDYMIGFQAGEHLLDLLDPGLVFFEEDGAATMVERSPHEAVMA